MDTFDSPRSSVPARLTGHRAAPLAQRFAANSHESNPSPISIRVALRGARRYWWLVLAVWSLGSAAIAATIFLKVKPTYRATSLLRVSPSETDLYNIRGHGELLEQFLNTQVSLIISPNVLTAAGTNPKAVGLPRIQGARDVVIELRKVILVAIIPNTYLIEVSMISPSAYESATLVNAVVDAFIESNSEWSEGMTRSQIKNLEVYLGDLKNQSDEKERRWRELVQKAEGGVIAVKPPNNPNNPNRTNDPAPAAAANPTIDEYKRIQSALFEVTMELMKKGPIAEKLRRDFDNVSSNPAEVGQQRSEAMVTRRLQADPEIRSLYKAGNDAKAKLDEIIARTRHGSDPAISKARARFVQLQNEYADLWEGRKQNFLDEAATGGGPGFDPEREVREAEAEVGKLKILKETLTAELAKVKLENKKLVTDAVELELIHESRASLTGMQQVVNKRLEQLKFESKGEARIRPVNAAVPPGSPLSDKRVQYLAMAPVGVLGLVLVLVVLLEIRSGRVGDTDVLSSRVRHEVFSIAPLPNIRPGEDASSGQGRAAARPVRPEPRPPPGGPLRRRASPARGGAS